MSSELAARVVTIVTAGVLGAILTVPSPAEGCTWDQEIFAQLPANGQVVAPDTSIMAVMDQLLWRSVQPVLINEDGERIVVPVPDRPQTIGGYTDLFSFDVYHPDEDLAPGTYTLTFEYDGTALESTTTFEVAGDLPDNVPAVSEFEWMTRVFEHMMEADSCSRNFVQQSRFRFPRPRSSDDERPLFYIVRMMARGDFDGEVDRGESRYGKTAAIPDPSMDPESGLLSYDRYGRIEGDQVTVTVNTPFKVECVEIYASDMSGNRSKVMQRCVPDRCVSSDATDYWGSVELFGEIDWSAQPDCSQEYDYCEELGDCGGGDADAGQGGDTGNDAGHDTGVDDAGDASTADIDSGVVFDTDTDSDATPDGPGWSSDSETTESSGCGCTTGDPRSVAPWALLLVVGIGVRRAITSR